MRVTLFACPSPDGQALAREVAGLCARLGCALSIPAVSTQTDFMLACLSEDVVVVDASLEPGCEHVYTILSDQPKYLDHILVASRTYLPLNFFGMREGGAPSYPHPLPEPGQEAPELKWANSEILLWLEEALTEIRDRPREPRLDFPTDDAATLVGLTQELFQASKTRREAARSLRERLFLSYRSRHHAGARELARRIESGEWHPRGAPEVVLLSPGELAYDRELLSEMRRWQVLGVLGERIGECRELWVYDTSDYLDSWWTAGELVLAAYHCGGAGGGPRLRAYSPESHTLSDEPLRYTVMLTEEQRARMFNLFQATGLDTMDPSNLRLLRLMRVLYRFGLGGVVSRWVSRAILPQYEELIEQMEVQLEGEVGKGPIRSLIEAITDPARFRSLLNTPLITRTFWEDLSVETGAAVLKQAGGRIDPERFLHFDDRLRRAVPLRKVARAAGTGRPLRVRGSAPLRVETRAPRLLWKQSKGDLGDPGMELLPTYLASS